MLNSTLSPQELQSKQYRNIFIQFQQGEQVLFAIKPDRKAWLVHYLFSGGGTNMGVKGFPVILVFKFIYLLLPALTLLILSILLKEVSFLWQLIPFSILGIINLWLIISWKRSY